MTDSNKKEESNKQTQSTDSATEVSKSTQSPPQSTGKQPASWPGKVGLALAIISLAGTGYLFWNNHLQTQANDALQSQLEIKINEGISSAKTGLTSQFNSVSQELNQFDIQAKKDKANVDELQQRLTTSIKELNARTTVSRNDWLVAEAEYLMRLANQRLQMEKSADGALALLQSADKVLKEVQDVSLYNVRKALAHDIAALEAVPELDTEGVYVRLAGLGDLVNKLPLTPLTDQHQLPEMLEQITPESVEKSWGQDLKAFWADTVETLSKLVVINHRDEPVEPLLSPEQNFYLQQNLHLMLEQAQLGLLRHQQGTFDTSLAKAIEWTGTYFDNADSSTQALLKGLKELQSVKVDPAMPEISGSLQTLKTHLEEMAKLKQEAGQ